MPSLVTLRLEFFVAIFLAGIAMLGLAGNMLSVAEPFTDGFANLAIAIGVFILLSVPILFTISRYKQDAYTNKAIVEVVWFSFLGLLAFSCASAAAASYTRVFTKFIFPSYGVRSCSKIPYDPFFDSSLSTSNPFSGLQGGFSNSPGSFEDLSKGKINPMKTMCNDNIGIIIVGFALFGILEAYVALLIMNIRREGAKTGEPRDAFFTKIADLGQGSGDKNFSAPMRSTVTQASVA